MNGYAHDKMSRKSEVRSFPPPRNFSSLCVGDLLDARESYHNYLSSLENVVATAIGRYRIHGKDWFATHPPGAPRPKKYRRIHQPRTLSNSVVTDWSWPAVLVFVRHWEQAEKLGNQAVPRYLYLPDGRIIPTCVIQSTPDESPPQPVPRNSQASPLLGGGYSCLRAHQGVNHLGSFGCLVYKDGSYYALTNRHVAGQGGDVVQAYLRDGYHPVGSSADMGLTRIKMPDAFPTWSYATTYLTLDAGLVKIDDFDDWTSQVYGIGEIDLPFDAKEQSITLDLIGCPVRAFGGTSGVIEGEIHALFFRYESIGGHEHCTDVLIGPRTGTKRRNPAVPFTRPGDSGTLWFYDPPRKGRGRPGEDLDKRPLYDRGHRARRLKPIAMQWGGERFREPSGSSSAFALAAFISTICRALDVDIVRDWSTGHDEYWGKLAHFAIGWKACNRLEGKLSTLMLNNQVRIGCGDDRLREGSQFRMGRDGFVPLADVPDYVLVNSRPNENVQHFADVDIQDIHGGRPLLDRCVEDPRNVSAKVWKEYFDGFAQAGVGPDEGVLPFRVWQLWEAMVDYLKMDPPDIRRFLVAAGILAHYVADASQPLHCSYMHHGIPPMTSFEGRDYPVRREMQEFKDFEKTREYKIHSIFDETVLEIDTPDALNRIDQYLSQDGGSGPAVTSGHAAAVRAIALMNDVRTKLPPKTIIEADDPEETVKNRAKALWNNGPVQDAIVRSIADSIKLLGELWTSAWKKGGGDSIDDSELKTFGEPELQAIYRDQDFAPSMSLDQMVQNGGFEPK